MTNQFQLVFLLLKIVLVSGFASITLWVSDYTRQVRWWENRIALTIVVHALVVAGLLVPSTLSLFFNLTREDSLVVAWADVALIGAITPAMLWRIAVWRRFEASRQQEEKNQAASDSREEGRQQERDRSDSQAE